MARNIKATEETQAQAIEAQEAQEAQVSEEQTSEEAPKTRVSPNRSFSDDKIITLLSTDKKKRGKSAERLALYRTGMTVGEYLDACVALQGSPRGRWLSDIRWDIDHGFIEVGDEVKTAVATSD